MKIVFHFEEILPVKTYGGIERILFWHMKELVRQNHQVVLIGHPDSKVEEYGIQLIKIDLNQKASWENLIPKDADIIHLSYNHTPKNSIPTINTVHGNGKIGEKFTLNSVFVSKKHAEIHNSESFVHNAIDLIEYPFKTKELKWDSFLFLAKASWRVKNLKHTVWAARKARKHLHIIGGRWFGLSRFIHNHGIIGGDEKINIMNDCDALIFPVRWHEPFGIAIIEAMSQGLPVIGSSFGSLPELISEDVGYIVHSHQELLNVLSSPTKKFDSTKIRKYVEENFSISKHTKEYLNLYQKVIAGENLNKFIPQYKLNQRAEDLLDF